MEQETHLCVCGNEKRCPLRERMEPTLTEPSTENQFSNVHDLDKISYKECNVSAAPGSRICKPGYKMWKWLPCENCFLYYIFVYDDRDGTEEMYKRVREHEIVAPPYKLYHKIPEQLTLRVIPLFKKPESHGFVEIYNAKGCGDYGMVVDLLSAIKLEERYAIYFGFLTPSPTNFDQSTRIAVKREKIVQIADGSESIVSQPTSDRQSQESEHEAFEKPVEKIRREIELVFKVEGPYNMKYLACTDLNESSEHIWIALELCRMEIFKDLIMAGEGTRLFLDKQKKKICFSQILQGLMNLHENDIVHGEITAENILVSLDGAELKIGDYDHVKEVQNDQGHATINDDIIMTARVFLKCIKSDAAFDSKKLKDIDKQEIENWISTMVVTDDAPNSEQMIGYLSRVIEVVFYESKRASIRRYIQERGSRSLPRSWNVLFIKLAKELEGCNEDPYLSSYLIMYMAADEPHTKQVRTHPFFWDEYKMECFVRRIIALITKQNPRSEFAAEIEKSLITALECVCGLGLVHRGASAIYRNYNAWPESVVNTCGSNNNYLLSFAVCLLHRTVWPRRESEHLPRNIKHMLRVMSNLDHLNLRKSYLPRRLVNAS